jgi:hypothetical protein
MANAQVAGGVPVAGVLRLALGATLLLVPFKSAPWLGDRLGELSGEGWVIGGMMLLTLRLLLAGWRTSVRMPRLFESYFLTAWLVWALASSVIWAAAQESSTERIGWTS